MPSTMLKLSVFLVNFLIFFHCAKASGLTELYKWKVMEYKDLPDWVVQPNKEPTPEEIEADGLVSKTSYVPYNNLPVGVSHYKNRVFISMPRRRVGVPSTLNVIDIDEVESGDLSPKLKGFPDYEQNEVPSDLHPNPDRIISVYRTKMDECGRLWFVDTGYLEYPNHKVQVQRPSIWAIDVETKQRIVRFDIPESFVKLGDGFVSITPDIPTKDQCDNAFAYIPNMRTGSIMVYSMQQNRMWNVIHNTFAIEPRQGDFYFAGLGFQWSDGIFSIALGPRESNGFRRAYYHAMAALSEYYVSTEILQNEHLATRDYHGDDFKFVGSRAEQTQSAMHDLDPKLNIMIHSEISKNGVGCWNARSPFSSQGVIDQNNDTMIYPADIEVDNESYLWVITNRIPIYIYGRLQPDEYNYRIFKTKVSDAVKGTECARRTGSATTIANDVGNRFGDSTTVLGSSITTIPPRPTYSGGSGYGHHHHHHHYHSTGYGRQRSGVEQRPENE